MVSLRKWNDDNMLSSVDIVHGTDGKTDRQLASGALCVASRAKKFNTRAKSLVDNRLSFGTTIIILLSAAADVVRDNGIVRVSVCEQDNSEKLRADLGENFRVYGQDSLFWV